MVGCFPAGHVHRRHPWLCCGSAIAVPRADPRGDVLGGAPGMASDVHRHAHPAVASLWSALGSDVAPSLSSAPHEADDLFEVCLPQVWAEHLVLDVPWWNTKFDQGVADPMHERDRSAQVIGRIVGQVDLRWVHPTGEDALHWQLAFGALLVPDVEGGVGQY